MLISLSPSRSYAKPSPIESKSPPPLCNLFPPYRYVSSSLLLPPPSSYSFFSSSFPYHFGFSSVMIIDLDAHQGNGHERDFLGDEKNTYIVDMYNPRIYPHDTLAMTVRFQQLRVR